MYHLRPRFVDFLWPKDADFAARAKVLLWNANDLHIEGYKTERSPQSKRPENFPTRCDDWMRSYLLISAAEFLHQKAQQCCDDPGEGRGTFEIRLIYRCRVSTAFLI
jgi:hypothetical protein